MAADRGPYIDQSQSANMYLLNISPERMGMLCWPSMSMVVQKRGVPSGDPPSLSKSIGENLSDYPDTFDHLFRGHVEAETYG